MAASTSCASWLLLLAAAAALAAAAPVENTRNGLQRQLRSFPYSVSFVRLLNPDNSYSPYYGSTAGSDDDLSEMIDSINSGSAAGLSRERRSMDSPVKRYACRFKFCRIFDA